jgi:hypothetical protein
MGRKLRHEREKPIAAALIASGEKVFRYSGKINEPRSLFCAIGRCTDCVMTWFKGIYGWNQGF